MGTLEEPAKATSQQNQTPPKAKKPAESEAKKPEEAKPAKSPKKNKRNKEKSHKNSHPFKIVIPSYLPSPCACVYIIVALGETF